MKLHGADEPMQNIKRMSRRPSARATTAEVAKSARMFAALGDATRLRLIGALCTEGAMSIAQLTTGTNITRQAVSKHLRVLGTAGLVRDVIVGREHLWEFERAQLEEARHSLELIALQWDRALMKLRLALES